MIWLIVKNTLALYLLLTGLVGLIQASSGEKTALRELFTPPAGCPAPCWEGIQIGVTNKDEALTILNSHPWIGQIFSSDTQISWRWSGLQPALLDGQRDGLIGLRSGVVRLLRLQTHVQFGEFWALLDQPDDALLVRPLTRFSAFQIAQYDEAAIQVISAVNCPATPVEFWSSNATLGMGEVWTSEAINGIDFDVYGLKGWWRVVRQCRR
jgi:hypothetical protein